MASWCFAVVAAAVAARQLAMRRGYRLRQETEHELASWQAFKEAMMRDLHEIVSVAEGARIVHRAPSTIHGWMRAGIVRRVDSGGQGVPARLRVIDLMRAEHRVRGRGRPPQEMRPA